MGYHRPQQPLPNPRHLANLAARPLRLPLNLHQLRAAPVQRICLRIAGLLFPVSQRPPHHSTAHCSQINYHRVDQHPEGSRASQARARAWSESHFRESLSKCL